MQNELSRKDIVGKRRQEELQALMKRNREEKKFMPIKNNKKLSGKDETDDEYIKTWFEEYISLAIDEDNYLIEKNRLEKEMTKSKKDLNNMKKTYANEKVKLDRLDIDLEYGKITLKDDKSIHEAIEDQQKELDCLTDYIDDLEGQLS
jgi:hypothetical protein